MVIIEIQKRIRKELLTLHSASQDGFNFSLSMLAPHDPYIALSLVKASNGVLHRIVYQFLCSRGANQNLEPQQKPQRNKKWDMKVFVTNINYKSQQKTLWDFFENFGPVRHFRLLRQGGSNRSRGMAIISYKDKASVQRVLQATSDELTFDDRELVVKQAEWKQRSQRSPTRNNQECDPSHSDAHSSVNHELDTEPLHGYTVPDIHYPPQVLQSPGVNTAGEINNVSKHHGDLTNPPHSHGLCQQDANTTEFQATEVHQAFDPGEQREVKHNSVQLDRLHDDVILHIFSFLSLRQTVHVEQVCHRWRNLSLQTWQRLKHFQVSGLFSMFGGPDDRLVKKVLRRTNPGCLESVDLSYARRLTDSTVQVIGQLFPNLIQLDLSGSGVTNRGLRSLVELCRRLQVVKLNDCHNLGEDGLWWLFHRCKELRLVSLENIKRLKGPCLHVLCHGIKVFNLSGCSKLNDVGLKKLAAHLEHLIELRLDNCPQISDSSFDTLTQSGTTLQILHLGGMFQNLTSTGVAYVGRLHNLRELHLANNSHICDDTLGVISEGCIQLRVLDLTSCSLGVTDTGVARLASCLHLVHLKVSYLHQVHDEGLLPIYQNGHLQKLEARACSGVSDQGMEALAAQCCHLEELDVSGCLQLGPATLQAFVEAQTRECVLKLSCGGTSFDHQGADMPSTVCLVHMDFSQSHLRHDRELFFDTGSYDGDNYDEEQYGAEDGYADAGEGPAQWLDDSGDFLNNDDPLAVWDMS